ncbi:MAG TPA: S53 family peptidase [Jatrophihabitans sp.]|nr:S53 family peptidase [Jatrophihabitans sp.]
MPKRRITAVAATAATVLATTVAVAGSASATPASTAVPNTKPTWTAHAQHLGHASRSGAVHARVYLAPRGGVAALTAAARAVSTPGSASYHKFLSHAQYAQRFGTRSTTVAAVSKYLRASGLKVTGVGAGNRYVSVAGTVAAAEKAFGVSIDRYRRHNKTVQAPTSLVRVPSSIASSVLTVAGLDTTAKIIKPSSTPAKAPAGFRNARPCSTYYGEKTASTLPAFNGKTLPYAVCGYTGKQLRTAYEGATALDGAGVTVAITDAYSAPPIRGDANTYATRHGDQPFAGNQLVITKPTAAFNRQEQCGPSGWYGEETLDVEAVHARAPAARVHYYASASCFDDDFLDTLARVVDDNDSQIVTNSWSDLEANESPDTIAAYEQIFQQGALQGISFMFSSGDNGDEVANSGTKQVDYPASDPWATAVGGTATAIGANNNLMWSTGWGTHKWALSSNGSTWTSLGYLYGAGGGASALFAKPDYQSAAVPGTSRQVPDVGLDADPTTGMLIGETQIFPDGKYFDEYRIGGTSLASPLFAGMTALAVQSAGAGGGLLNYAIYGNRSAFTDVKGQPADAGNVRADYANGVDASAGIVYSVRTFNQNSSLKTDKGWDNVTGVGVPNPGWLTALG